MPIPDEIRQAFKEDLQHFIGQKLAPDARGYLCRAVERNMKNLMARYGQPEAVVKAEPGPHDPNEVLVTVTFPPQEWITVDVVLPKD